MNKTIYLFLILFFISNLLQPVKNSYYSPDVHIDQGTDSIFTCQDYEDSTLNYIDMYITCSSDNADYVPNFQDLTDVLSVINSYDCADKVTSISFNFYDCASQNVNFVENQELWTNSVLNNFVNINALTVDFDGMIYVIQQDIDAFFKPGIFDGLLDNVTQYFMYFNNNQINSIQSVIDELQKQGVQFTNEDFDGSNTYQASFTINMSTSKYFKILDSSEIKVLFQMFTDNLVIEYDFPNKECFEPISIDNDETKLQKFNSNCGSLQVFENISEKVITECEEITITSIDGTDIMQDDDSRIATTQGITKQWSIYYYNDSFERTEIEISENIDDSYTVSKEILEELDESITYYLEVLITNDKDVDTDDEQYLQHLLATLEIQKGICYVEPQPETEPEQEGEQEGEEEEEEGGQKEEGEQEEGEGEKDGNKDDSVSSPLMKASISMILCILAFILV